MKHMTVSMDLHKLRIYVKSWFAFTGQCLLGKSSSCFFVSQWLDLPNCSLILFQTPPNTKAQYSEEATFFFFLTINNFPVLPVINVGCNSMIIPCIEAFEIMDKSYTNPYS